MVEPQASRFWRAAEQSGLIDARRLAACWAQIAPEKRTPDAVDRRLARKAIEAGYLTVWQAQQLLAGRSGFQFDRYTLLALVGEGGMGRVYLAFDSRLARKVALKVLSRDRMNNPRAIKRFRREARVGAQLQHENLVRIYDEGQCNGHHYLVMEYIDGKTVGRLIQDRGPLPTPVAARVARQVALGLEHAHQKGMIHRDVNPMNILIDRDGAAKLTDLGLAIDLSDQEALVTRDGATVGTFDYIAPEQARHSRSVDTRADIYSLGCSLYHMIAGRVPFPQPSLPEKLYGHQALVPEPLSGLVPGVPPGLEAAVRRMMAKAPEGRFQRPAEVAEALGPFACGPLTLAEIEASSRSAPAGPSEGSTAAATLSGGPRGGSDADLAPLGPAGGGPASQGSDPLGLLSKLDLGPEPALSESLKGAGRSKARASAGSSGRSRTRLWVGAGAGSVLLLWAALALLGPGGMSDRSRGSGGVAIESGKPASAGQAPPIAVRWADGSLDGYDTLGGAIRAAVGKAAEVVLSGREPLRLEDGKGIDVPEGRLVLRAAEGAAPVLSVSLRGAAPFLKTHPRGPMEVRGITFVVEADERDTGRDRALIHAGGNLVLSDCTFDVADGDAGLHAVRGEGLRTVVEGCQFEGFQTPLALDGFPNALVRLEHCLFEQNRTAPPNAWALSLRHRIGKAKAPTRLEVVHDTIVGSGLLWASGFSAESPLEVKVERTIVHGQAMMMWPGGGPAPKAAMKWSGRDNRYDFYGHGWIVVEPNGFDVLPGGPTGLEAWKASFGEEPGSRAGPIRLAGGEATGPGPRPPAEFVPIDPADAKLGAEADRVGPKALRRGDAEKTATISASG